MGFVDGKYWKAEVGKKYGNVKPRLSKDFATREEAVAAVEAEVAGRGFRMTESTSAIKGVEWFDETRRVARVYDIRGPHPAEVLWAFDGLAGKQRPSVDHSILSPSGKVSKRSRDAAIERTRKELFTDDEGNPIDISPKVAQPSERETLLRRAAELRTLASRGMSVRKYTAEAERLEAEAAKLGGVRAPRRAALGAAPGDVDGFVAETTDAVVVHAVRAFERAGLTIRGPAGDVRLMTAVTDARLLGIDVGALRADQTQNRIERFGRHVRVGPEVHLWRAEIAYAWFARQFVRGATGDVALNVDGQAVEGGADGQFFDAAEFETREARLGLDLWRLGRNVAAQAKEEWKKAVDADATIPTDAFGPISWLGYVERVLEPIRVRLNWPRLPDDYDPPPPSQWPEVD